MPNVGSHVGMPVSPMLPPAAVGPPRDRSKTPPKRALASTSRSESSPPDRGGQLARPAKRGATSDREAFSNEESERMMWKLHTESLLVEQKARFEVVADEWMAASRSMFRSEQTEFRQEFVSEENAMALWAHEHGKQERRNLENQMLETMQKTSVAQSRKFEEAIVAQRNQLEGVAQREAASFRLQWQSWQHRFADINTQQNLRVSSLESMLQQAEERDRAQRNQASELRSEGLECAQMLRNAE